MLVGPLAALPLARAAETGCLLIDAGIAEPHGPALLALAERLVASPARPILLPAGEAAKAPDAIARVWSELVERRLDRGALLIAAGGGAALDAANFAAGTYLRGVSVVNVPTTFLAQVDAAVGGKSALDVGGAKNQVGLIRQPALVLVDAAFLETLPAGAFRSGLGELAKCALLCGGDLHALVADRAEALVARDREAIEEAVFQALFFKASVVVRDPFDRGERAVLNAGHTIGHVIEAEALARGVPLSHGEAVAIGLSCESQEDGRADRAAILNVLERLGLPRSAPFPISEERARALLAGDKKRRGDTIRIPVVEAPGSVALRDVPVARLAASMAGGRGSAA